MTLGEKLANVYPTGRLIYIFKAANLTLLLRLLLITPVFILVGILISHRIAGPIYRLGTYIDQLITGDYSSGLVLRKKDELKGLAHKLSLLRGKLKKNEEERSGIIRHIEEASKSQDKKKINELINQLKEM